MEEVKEQNNSLKELAETITYLETRAYNRGFEDCKNEVLFLFSSQDLKGSVYELLLKIKNLGGNK